MRRISDLVGKPFREDAMGPDAYCCWGLAVEVFRRFGVSLPDYRMNCESVASGVISNREQWVRCAGEVPVPALIVFTTAGICDHLGVYLGDGKFIHAHESAGVVVVRADHIFWKRRIEGYYTPYQSVVIMHDLETASRHLGAEKNRTPAMGALPF